MNINKILNFQFSEPMEIKDSEKSLVSITFKKTAKVKQYETEAVSITLDLPLSNRVGAPEKYVISSFLEIQSEFIAIESFCAKGIITQNEYTDRVKSLELYADKIAARYKAITGKDVESVFNMQFTGTPSYSEISHTQDMMNNKPVMQRATQQTQMPMTAQQAPSLSQAPQQFQQRVPQQVQSTVAPVPQNTQTPKQAPVQQTPQQAYMAQQRVPQQVQSQPGVPQQATVQNGFAPYWQNGNTRR